MTSREVSPRAIALTAALASSVVLVSVGPALAHMGVVPPLAGFGLFMLGSALAVVPLIVGVVSLIRSRRAGTRPRRLQWCAVGWGALLLVGLYAVWAPARGLPRINDITTDPSDPPAFVAAGARAGNADRDLAYPRSFEPLQRRAYPDLQPIRLDKSADEAFAAARAAVAHLGWQGVVTAPEARTIEATDESRVFRFVDDISIRVRNDGEVSVVDVRSKSRDGKGDLGANAARIRRFREALTR